MIKAGHNGGILAGIMHMGIPNMLIWQRIKQESGVRVTSVHACIGKHIFCEELQKLFHASILLRVGENFESSPLNKKGGSSTLIANLGPVWIHVLELVWVSLNSTSPKKI